eukprot:scaffold863_cov101-Isochrysis_galbana.AAC.1
MCAGGRRCARRVGAEGTVSIAIDRTLLRLPVLCAPSSSSHAHALGVRRSPSHRGMCDAPRPPLLYALAFSASAMASPAIVHTHTRRHTRGDDDGGITHHVLRACSTCARALRPPPSAPNALFCCGAWGLGEKGLWSEAQVPFRGGGVLWLADEMATGGWKWCVAEVAAINRAAAQRQLGPRPTRDSSILK